MSKVNSQKYSRALLEIAQEKHVLEEILEEINELRTVMTSLKLTVFFRNNVYSEVEKSSVVDSMEKNSSILMKNFLDVIRNNGRLSDLEEILTEVKNSADDMFKISDVEVISSIPLTNVQTEKIVQLSKIKFDLNEVTINNSVDNDILGGFIINSRGKIIDASIKTQLAKIAGSIL